VDLAAGELEMTQGIGGSESTYLHEIALYIPGRPVKITAAFKDRLPVAGLLGMHGFFESFRVSFHPDSKFARSIDYSGHRRFKQGLVWRGPATGWIENNSLYVLRQTDAGEG
jgi:hypothetical protein